MDRNKVGENREKVDEDMNKVYSEKGNSFRKNYAIQKIRPKISHFVCSQKCENFTLICFAKK